MIQQWIKPRNAEFKKTWCVFNERHRTTNFLEGWHHALNNAVGKKKPSINMLLIILLCWLFTSSLSYADLTAIVDKQTREK